jgi:hypothetical protein
VRQRCSSDVWIGRTPKGFQQFLEGEIKAKVPGKTKPALGGFSLTYATWKS